MTEIRKAAGANQTAVKNAQLNRNKDRISEQADFKHGLQEFEEQLCLFGFNTKDGIVADGKLHRFYILGDKKGSLNGWYVLFTGSILAGAFGSWKTGLKQTWCSESRSTLSASEKIVFKKQMENARKEREEAEEASHAKARQKAQSIWEKASLANDHHPYLIKKSVRNYGLKVHKNFLIVPLLDSDGIMQSLQFIDGDGAKRFLSGGRKKGCHFLIGTPKDSLCIAEGYATAASIHEFTGHPVAVAFDAGNLLSVSLSLRRKHPNTQIIICADNDEHTLGNPGLTNAREAASAIQGLLAVPPRNGDFNDFLTGGRHEQ